MKIPINILGQADRGQKKPVSTESGCTVWGGYAYGAAVPFFNHPNIVRMNMGNPGKQGSPFHLNNIRKIKKSMRQRCWVAVKLIARHDEQGEDMNITMHRTDMYYAEAFSGGRHCRCAGGSGNWKSFLRHTLGPGSPEGQCYQALLALKMGIQQMAGKPASHENDRLEGRAGILRWRKRPLPPCRV